MKGIQIQSRIEGALSLRLKAPLYKESVIKEAVFEEFVDSLGNKHAVEVQAAEVGRVYNNVGKDLCNIFATIDRINFINMDLEEFVIGVYMMEQYDIMPEFAIFLRPAKLVPPGMQGVKVLDLMKDADKLDVSGCGEILAPNAFYDAQLRLLKAFNPKCSRITGLIRVSREVLDVSDKVINSYPVVINGKMMAVEKNDIFQQFVLSHKFLRDSAYIYNVEDELDVKEKAQAWVTMVGERATDRESLSTNLSPGAKGSAEDTAPSAT